MSSLQGITNSGPSHWRVSWFVYFEQRDVQQSLRLPEQLNFHKRQVFKLTLKTFFFDIFCYRKNYHSTKNEVLH